MLCGLSILVLLVMKLWPETPLARMLHVHLVERPLAALERLERTHLIYAFVLIFVLLSMGEFIAIFGGVDFAFVYAWDLSLYLDAALATYAISAISHVKVLGRWSMRRLQGLLRRPEKPSSGRRQIRSVSRTLSTKAANEDDPVRPVVVRSAA